MENIKKQIEEFMEGVEILEIKEDRSFKETFFRKDGKVYSKLEASFGGVTIAENKYYDAAQKSKAIRKELELYTQGKIDYLNLSKEARVKMLLPKKYW